MEGYEQLKNKAINMNSDIKASRRKLRNSKQEIEEYKEELEELNQNYKVQDNAVEIMKEIVDRMSRGHIEKVEELVTFGLQTIFYDRNYALDINVEEKRNNKAAEFYLIEKKGDSIIKTSFEESIGGGVRVIVGFLLQVFYIRYFDLAPIVFVDESFSQLSTRYIEGLITFINKLAEKRGFKVILITHDKRLEEHANVLYRVDMGEVILEKDGEGDDG